MAQTNGKKTGTRSTGTKAVTGRELEFNYPMRSSSSGTKSGSSSRSSSTRSAGTRSGSSSSSSRSSSTRSTGTRSGSSSRSSSAKSTGTRSSSSTRSASNKSAASRSGGRAVAKKSGSNGASAKTRANERASGPEHIDEIIGVLFIALGIVMGILTYVKTGAVLGSLVERLFGLFGVIQYAVPVVLVLLGIVLIAVPRRQVGSGAILMILLALFFVNCVVHLATTSYRGQGFVEYLNEALELGSRGHGGGLLAAAPCYGLAKLVSVGGAIVIFVAIALILVLLATRVSIRSTGKKIAEKAEAHAEERRARREEEERTGVYSGRRRRQTTDLRIGSEYDVHAYFSDQGDLKLAEGEESLSAASAKGRKNSRMKVERLDLNTVIENAAPQSGDEPALADLPKTGILPFGRSKAAKKAAEAAAAEAAAIAAANKVAYDPYETIEIKPNDNITGETVEKRPKAPAEGKKPETKPAENKEGAKPETAVAPEELAEPAALQVYQRPPISLLRRADHSEQIANDSPTEKAKLLIETLASFNINARVVNISVGPVITRFEIQPAQGVRVNRITSLSNDIALALAAPRVRIEAPIPGKAAVGIEIPNKDTAMVRLREVLDTREFSAASSPLTFALGKDIAGKPVYADLERMPHMLIAGATGSGKSVCINSIILSTVYKSSPDEVRMILIDPKVVELSIFAPIPHLYCPIVNDPKKAAGVLKWACVEMDKRYNKMSTVNARDLARYNSQMKDPADRMPRLMIIIDELADLMIVSAKDVEESIARLAQLGRAAGIHLIVATQRPSVDVLTGLIKANIPSRIAFAVSSAIDSRVILDGSGAEKLLGHGDMLFHPNGAAKPIRAQGAYVSDEEVENIMQFFVDHKIEVPQDEKIINFVPDLTGSTGQGNGKQEDDLLPDAVRIVMDSGSASISMIQRRLRVGYARAARLVDIMEQMKLVSGFDGSKPRKVLITEAGYQELFGGGYTPPADTDEDMVDVPFDTEDE